MFTGRQNFYWVWVETTRWSGLVTDLNSWFEQGDADFQDRYELGEDNGVNWSIMDGSDVFKSAEWADWKIWGNLKMNSISAFLYNVLWSKTTTIPEAGVYQHAMTLLENNLHPSLVIANENPIEKKLYSLAMVKSFEISASIWEVATVSIDLESKGWVVDAAITKTFTVDENFLARFGIFKLANTYAWLDAAASMNLRSFKMTFTPNTERRWSLWNIGPAEILNKTYNVSWTVEFDYADNIVKDLATNATKQALQFAIIDTEKTIWLVSNPTLDFRFYRVAFTSYEVSAPVDDVVTQSLNFKALYDFWNAATLTCKLINTLNF